MQYIIGIVILVLIFQGMASCVFRGCDSDDARAETASEAVQPPPKPKTWQEELGMSPYGKLAPSAEAWAESNELGEYYRISQERIQELGAKLKRDYKLRKDSEMAATKVTHHLLRDYEGAVAVDDILREHIVSCCSLGEVQPLPESIRRMFAEPVDGRALLRDAPEAMSSISQDYLRLQEEVSALPYISLSMIKPLSEWNNLFETATGLKSEISSKKEEVSTLAAAIQRVADKQMNNDEAQSIADEAAVLKRDFTSLLSKITQYSATVLSQQEITGYSDNCEVLLAGCRKVPEMLAKKKERCKAMTELRSELYASKNSGFSNFVSLESRAKALLDASRAAAEEDRRIGKEVQELASSFADKCGNRAMTRLQRKLTDAGARARVKDVYDSFVAQLNLSERQSLEGYFAKLESCAYQLADRMEEGEICKKLEDALNAVLRLAKRK